MYRFFMRLYYWALGVRVPKPKFERPAYYDIIESHHEMGP